MHGRNAAAAQLLLDAEIEVRRINTHEDARIGSGKLLDEFGAKPQKTRQMRKNLNVASHGEFADVVPGMEPGSPHARSAHAVLSGSLKALFDLREREARDVVAARFSGKPDDAVGFKSRIRTMSAHVLGLLPVLLYRGRGECFSFSEISG